MKYKLIEGSLNDPSRIEETFFKNRGINDYKNHFHLNDSCLHDYCLLDNIAYACYCFEKHLRQHSRIHIVVDSDTDGYVSSAMLYSYIMALDDTAKISYSIHANKTHGLTPDVEIPDDVDLILIPDAGSSDVEQCRQLAEEGREIIVLDHHNSNVENKYAIVVNSQSIHYPNSDLCGAGVVYKFLQAMDDRLWCALSDQYLDLVALASIADVMDMRSQETRWLVEKGLRNIRNPLLKAFIVRQAFYLRDRLTITGIQYYIAPLINALIRVGSMQEKTLLFKGFLTNDKNICAEVCRIAIHAKYKQKKAVEQGVKALSKKVADSEDSVLIIDAKNELNQALSGLVANKLAEMYHRPCLLLRPQNKDQTLWCGSGRNIENSQIPNLQAFLQSLLVFQSVEGHNNAFGVKILKENIPKAIQLANNSLHGKSFSAPYKVDFVLHPDTVTIDFIRQVDKLLPFFGPGITEPLMAVEKLCLERDGMELLGAEEKIWKYVSDNGVTFIHFRTDKPDPILLWLKENNNGSDTKTITLIGVATVNVYKCFRTPQIVIKDYETCS